MPMYHKRIPADGVTHYTKGTGCTVFCFRRRFTHFIPSTRLPLVRQVEERPRPPDAAQASCCGEISASALATFNDGAHPIRISVEAGTVVEWLDGIRVSVRFLCLLGNSRSPFPYNSAASRYHPAVYQRKRANLSLSSFFLFLDPSLRRPERRFAVPFSDDDEETDDAIPFLTRSSSSFS